ncbi:MAG: rhodanese [Variovorax sp.]|nr:MAG: rhodanese [Variovorax sp.]
MHPHPAPAGHQSVPTAGITPEALQAMLLGDSEMALLDVREARAFHAGHLNLARSAPLSGLELQIVSFVPRRRTTVVLYDDADEEGGTAARAATLLERLGYADVRQLLGGLQAWEERGLPWIDGWNTLVKAFGDRVREHYGTRVLPLSDLQVLRDSDAPVTLVDVRPPDEFAFLSIAGARNHPGTELALRAFPSGSREDGAGEPVWAVNCFSRTRGILGATTLKVLGQRRAAFVEDGVMAWGLRGGLVLRNAEPVADLPTAAPGVLAERAALLRARADLRVIDAAQLTSWRSDPDRTLHIFDVRPEPGTATAAAADVRHVPGGQVLMHFEQLVGTRRARIVLVDDPHGLRAAVTAFWLKQFNQCEVAVLAGEAPPRSSPIRTVADRDDAIVPQVDAAALSALLATGGTTIVDVGPSEDFERQHLPGARFLLPASMSPLAPLIVHGGAIVFTSPDGQAARVAAENARREWPGAALLLWLEGGTHAWAASGRPTQADYAPDDLLTPFDDHWGSTMRVSASCRDAVWRHYLAWERALAARVAHDPTVRFRLLDLDLALPEARKNPHVDS